MRLENFRSVLVGAKSLVKQNCSRADLSLYFNREGIKVTPSVLKDFIRNVDKVEDYNITINL